MKVSSLATPLASTVLVLLNAGALITARSQAQTPPQAGYGLSTYPPGAIQPPVTQMPVAPVAPKPPPGPPPAGFNVYQPPTIGRQPPMPPPPQPRAAASSSKGTAKSGSSKSGSSKSTSKKTSYRPPALTSTEAKTKSGSTLESRVGKLESSDHRQDLRLGRLERDVGLLPDTIEGGGVADKVPTGKMHVVRPGDTLFSVASRYHTSVGELRSLNRLSSDTLDIGETLLIPDSQTWSVPGKPAATSIVHIVASGEGFSEIARAYGVRADDLARANPSVYATDLRAGERLIVPNPMRIPRGHDDSRDDRGNGLVTVDTSTTHTVKKGDTLGKIAAKYHTTVSKIASANRLRNANVIPLGKRLVIPGTRTTRRDPGVQDDETRPLAQLRLFEEPVKPTPPSPPAMPTTPPDFDATLTSVTPTLAEKPKTDMPRGIVAYRAERGDTLESIANMFSTTAENIRVMNKLPADKKLKEGDEVYVPTVGAVSVN